MVLLNLGFIGQRKLFKCSTILLKQKEKLKIVEEDKGLMKRLAEYKPYFKLKAETGHH
jgi:hypothetical protein